MINTDSQKLDNNDENNKLALINDIFKIIICNSFLNERFEKYYNNFLVWEDFNQEVFEKSINYVLQMLSTQTYKDRVENIDKYEEIFIKMFKWNNLSIETLNKSIEWDIVNVIWKENEFWELDFDLVDLSIINDKNKISIIKTSIKQYLKSLIDEIKQKIKLNNVINALVSIQKWTACNII